MFIVYVGNNEVVGPYGAGTVFSPMLSTLHAIRASVFVKSTRLGGLLTDAIRKLGGARGVQREWGGMEMFLGQQVRAADPRLQKVYVHFRDNLTAILETARGAGVPVLLSTVAVNLRDAPPFASVNSPSLQGDELRTWRGLLDEGRSVVEEGRDEDAAAVWASAAAIDGGHAELQYLLGRAYLASGREKEGREALRRARDLDTLRFRADTEINDIIRSVAASMSQKDIGLLDTAQELAARSPHALPGAEFFYEHVHFNFEGNYAVARMMLSAMESMVLPGPAPGEAAVPVPTGEECADRLAFTDFDRRRVGEEMLRRTAKPPFSARTGEERRRETQRNALALAPGSAGASQATSLARYRRALELRPDDSWLSYNLAGLLLAMGDFAGAEARTRDFLTRIPVYPPARDRLIKALIEQGKFDDAVVECRKVLQLRPNFSPVLYHLAYVSVRRGELEQAERVYERLLELEPANAASIYIQLGKIALYGENAEKAARMFTSATLSPSPADEPSVADAYFNLGVTLKRLGRKGEASTALEQARRGYAAALARNPEAAATHSVMGMVLAESGDAAGAERSFREAVRLDPANQQYSLNLIMQLDRSGKRMEARAELESAIRWREERSLHQSAAELKEGASRLLGG